MAADPERSVLVRSAEWTPDQRRVEVSKKKPGKMRCTVEKKN